MSLWLSSVENSRLRAILRANGAVAVLGDITEDKDNNRALDLIYCFTCLFI